METARHVFAFDHWAALAERSDRDFERVRRAVIAQEIECARAADRRRLHGLQWRVDSIRELAGGPLAACCDVAELMWQHTLGAEGLVAQLERLGFQPQSAASERARATVVMLAPRAPPR